jgi:hypothetical protein
MVLLYKGIKLFSYIFLNNDTLQQKKVVANQLNLDQIACHNYEQFLKLVEKGFRESSHLNLVTKSNLAKDS